MHNSTLICKFQAKKNIKLNYLCLPNRSKSTIRYKICSLTYPTQQCTSQQFAKCTVQQGFRLLKPPSSELHSDLRTKIPQYHNNKYKLQQFHFLVTAMHDLN